MWYRTPHFSQQHLSRTQEMFKWCHNNISKDEWFSGAGVDTIVFYFEKQEDYVHFMMLWYGRE